MQYKNKLLAPSFRGVPFKIKDINTTIGRRIVTHEYPFRSEPYSEDLGRRAREYSINAYVMNPDDYTQSEALRSALEDYNTPGTLVHPTIGQVQVMVKDCTHTFSNTEGGIEYFSVTFSETTSNNFPSRSIDTQSRLRTAVGNLIDSSNNYFASNFSTSGHADFIGNGAIVNLNSFATKFRNILNFGSAQNNNPSEYSRIIARLNKFEQDIPTLIATPLELANTINDLNTDLNNSFSNNLSLADLMQSRLYEFGSDFIIIAATTSLREIEAANQNQVIYLIRVSALAGLLINVSKTTFESSDDAITARNSIIDKAQPLLETLANTFEDELYIKLTDALTAMVLDIRARSINAAPTRTHRIADSMPAMVLAYEFVNDATKANDLVARNKIVNPLFVPAYSDVKVVDA